ncbi:MAG: hypothetical protein HYZ42_00895, partial [Bacteroidetes bacterium]|nr:hypothetical protein [Bacteroidota bacterium]
IEITHGLFSLYGQTLPEDICIEVDDINNNTTLSEVIFARNSILPLKKTLYKELSRTIKKGSTDNLIINILEGNQAIHPSANKVIGVIEINGNMIDNDLIVGSDVEISIEISESREISVSAILSFTNQTFNHIFNPKEKYISLMKLKEELRTLQSEIHVSFDKILQTDDFEKAAQLNDLSESCKKLAIDIGKLRENDMDENKYQLEEQKRRIATEYYNIGVNNSPVYDKKEKLQNLKNHLDIVMPLYHDIPKELHEEYQEMVANYGEAIKSNNHFQLNTLYMKLSRFYTKLIYATPSLLANFFYDISALPPTSYKNHGKVEKLAERGENAISKNNHKELLGIVNEIWAEIIDEHIQIEKIKGTGLGS